MKARVRWLLVIVAGAAWGWAIPAFGQAFFAGDNGVILPGIPKYDQRDDVSCGPTSVAMVLKAYGIDAGQGPLKTAANTRVLEWNSPFGDFRLGFTTPSGIERAFESRGVGAKVYNASKEGMVDAIRTRHPIVLLVRSGYDSWHWIVVHGERNNGDEFFVTDPAGGSRPGWRDWSKLGGAMQFSHDTEGNHIPDPKCRACNGTGYSVNTDCPGCDGGWIKGFGFKTKCALGCNGGRNTVGCPVCGGDGTSTDIPRKAVETWGVSGNTMVVPDRPIPERNQRPNTRPRDDDDGKPLGQTATGGDEDGPNTRRRVNAAARKIAQIADSYGDFMEGQQHLPEAAVVLQEARGVRDAATRITETKQRDSAIEYMQQTRREWSSLKKRLGRLTNGQFGGRSRSLLEIDDLLQEIRSAF